MNSPLLVWLSKPEFTLRSRCPWRSFAQTSARVAGMASAQIYGAGGPAPEVLASLGAAQIIHKSNRLFIAVGLFKRRIRQCRQVGAGIACWRQRGDVRLVQPSTGGHALAAAILGGLVARANFWPSFVELLFLDVATFHEGPIADQPVHCQGQLLLYSWLRDEEELPRHIDIGYLEEVAQRHLSRIVIPEQYEGEIEQSERAFNLLATRCFSDAIETQVAAPRK